MARPKQSIEPAHAILGAYSRRAQDYAFFRTTDFKEPLNIEALFHFIRLLLRLTSGVPHRSNISVTEDFFLMVDEKCLSIETDLRKSNRQNPKDKLYFSKDNLSLPDFSLPLQAKRL